MAQIPHNQSHSRVVVSSGPSEPDCKQTPTPTELWGMEDTNFQNSSVCVKLSHYLMKKLSLNILTGTVPPKDENSVLLTLKFQISLF